MEFVHNPKEKKEIFICIFQSLNSSKSIMVGTRKGDGLERSMLTTKEEKGEEMKGREGTRGEGRREEEKKRSRYGGR